MPTLEDGRAAVEQGNLQQARLIFEAILQETPRSEDAWLGLADVLTDSEDKRICYENALKINKTSLAAKEGLRNLEPRSNPLIEALSQQSREEEVELEDDDDEYDDSERVPESAVAEDDGPPTVALIAIGLLLSVVVFAIGSGAVFFIITATTGG